MEIYDEFGELKDWDFRNYICRAVVSISNNIAEGFDRSSNLDFRRFLYMSSASCSEVKSMLYLSRRLGFLNAETTAKLLKQSVEISKILAGLIKSLDTTK